MREKKLSVSIWKSLLSVLALGIFILLAAGSWWVFSDYQGVYVQTVWRPDGSVEETTEYNEDGVRYVTDGRLNKIGIWTGPVTIKSFRRGSGIFQTEEVYMANGKRHGKSKITDNKGNVEIHCYDAGYRIDCQDSNRKSVSALSSFQVLSDKYPWFINTLNLFGFADDYIQAYMDTIETVLDNNDFEVSEFASFYDDVLSELKDTPYDSIIDSNASISAYLGMGELKYSELRLAVIDHYRSEGQSTNEIVNVSYPTYLSSLSYAGVSGQDFEGFCEGLDSLMSSYGPLDLEDHFFIDSIDARLFRALVTMLDLEETEFESLKSAKIWTASKFKYQVYNDGIDSTTAEVAKMVFLLMLQNYDQGDLIKRSVWEAYLENKGVVKPPLITTGFLSHNSGSSVTLHGRILDDGGGTVTTRGIALAGFYNPTTSERIEPSGSGTGEFELELNDLVEGTSYFARAYATNSAGTAYGNCISFTANGTVDLDLAKEIVDDLKIFPNPSSGVTTIGFQLEFSQSMTLNIIDLKGQIVYMRDLEGLSQGKNLVKLDLTSLEGGMYQLQLWENGTLYATRKLILVH